MPELTNEQLSLYLAIVAAATVVALFVVSVLALRLRKLRREYAILRGDGEERDVIASVAKSAKHVEALGRRLDEMSRRQDSHEEATRSAIQRFAMVRYNAFEDMGGMLSFSAAFLDDHGNGVVLTSINGRTETRTYAKEISGLSSEHNLSDEERQAIGQAAAAARTPTPTAAAR